MDVQAVAYAGGGGYPPPIDPKNGLNGWNYGVKEEKEK